MSSRGLWSTLAIFIVLMVAFGRNPLEKDLKKINDPLGTSIETQLTKPAITGVHFSGLAPVMGGAPPGYSGYPGYSSYAGAPSWQPQPQAEKRENAAPQRASAPQGPDANIPQYFLKDGRRIFFGGAKVFTLTDDGQLKPLPDGEYTLQGDEKIFIKNGRRQANP